ncbi:hypothetical protein [Chitinophaga sp. MM2321]|uniref:hypothetical protein n=1 Tax=Chitinophaga sp. MM2321 TaxID=3137178 RepID=UPI0032D56EB0
MLTDKKRKEFKELFEKVNISSICKEYNISRVVVWRFVNGKSKKVKKMTELGKVIAKARKEKAAIDKQIHNL